MKQALILLIVLSLFSFLLAIKCPSPDQLICEYKSRILTCICIPKTVKGHFAFSHSCIYPQRPECSKNGNSINSIDCSCK